MQGFLALSNLFSKMSSFPEERRLAHQLILESVTSTIAKARSGLLAVNQGDGWLLTASLPANGKADLTREIDQFLSDSTLKTTKQVLCGTFGSDQGDRIALRLDAGIESGLAFAAEDKVLFKVALDLVSSYESFNRARLETRNAQETVKRILDLVSGLRDSERDNASFFSELLQSALSVVDEADYGSVALFDGTWKFVAAVGHDWEGLRDLNIPSEAFGSFTDVAVVEDLVKDMPHLEAYSMPIARSLIVGMDVGPDYRINLSLDIRKGSRKRFSENSKLAIDRFVKLASSFLRLRLQREFVEKSYRNFTDKLALLAEAHDRNTALHNVRVSLLSGFLAERLGLEPSRVRGIRKGAMVHDIGKLFIAPELLNKKGRLTDEEREKLKEHTLLAEKLLDDPYFALDQRIAVYHHERYDGRGYPRGLKGDEIPIEAQIVSAADVYDALRDTRPYKSSFSPQEALSRMRYGDHRLPAGGFNPEILAILEENWESVEALWTAQEFQSTHRDEASTFPRPSAAH